MDTDLATDLVRSPANRIQAAQYIRMSTEHQRYSPQNQAQAIEQYAVLFGIDVVRTYSDLGKSGLKINNRAGLKTLLDDVEKCRHDFQCCSGL